MSQSFSSDFSSHIPSAVTLAMACEHAPQVACVEPFSNKASHGPFVSTCVRASARGG